MYDDLEKTLQDALAYLREARKPHPLVMPFTMEAMTRKAIEVGGKRSHVCLTCRIEDDGKASYSWEIWDDGTQLYVSYEPNAVTALEKFAVKCARQPEPKPPNKSEDIEMILAPELTPSMVDATEAPALLR